MLSWSIKQNFRHFVISIESRLIHHTCQSKLFRIKLFLLDSIIFLDLGINFEYNITIFLAFILQRFMLLFFIHYFMCLTLKERVDMYVHLFVQPSILLIKFTSIYHYCRGHNISKYFLWSNLIIIHMFTIIVLISQVW